MTAQNVVLAPGVDLDAIEDLASHASWQLTNVLPAVARRPAQRIFTTADGSTIVYFVEDARLGIVYVAAQGDGASAALNAVSARLSTVPALSPADIERDPSELAPALAALALQGVESPEGAAVLSALLEHDDPRRRSLALTALTYCPWPSLEPLVVTMASSDPDPGLRQAAGQVLAALYR